MASTQDSNYNIIKKLLKGDTSSFELLIDREQPSLVHYSRGFSSDVKTANSIAKRVLKKGFRNLHKLRPNSLFSSYLLGLLNKECRKRDLNIDLKVVSPFWIGLSKLSRVHREVVFFFFQGYKLGEIADIRKDSPGLTRSRFISGLKRVEKKVFCEDKGENENSTENDSGIEKKSQRKLGIESSCHVIHMDQMYLGRADGLNKEDKELLEKHIKECNVCKKNWEKTGEFFKLLRDEIAPFKGLKPLLNHFPGPSPVWIALETAAILALVITAFFIFKAAFTGGVKELFPG